MAKQLLLGSGSCGYRTYASVNPEVRPPSKSGAWVVDSGGFRRLVDMEIQKAQRLRYCVSIACIAADRRSPEEEEPAVAILAERVTPLIRSTDVVTCWDPPCLALMLIDADVASLPSIVDRLTTRLEIVLVELGWRLLSENRHAGRRALPPGTTYDAASSAGRRKPAVPANLARRRPTVRRLRHPQLSRLRDLARRRQAGDDDDR